MIKIVTGKKDIGKSYKYFWNYQDMDVSFCSEEILISDKSIYDYLTYENNIIIDMDVLNKIGIEDLGVSINTLSLDKQKFLGVYQVFLKQAKLYVLDEPTNNVDQHHFDLIWDLILNNSDKDIKIITEDSRLFDIAHIQNIDLMDINEYKLDINYLAKPLKTYKSNMSDKTIIDKFMQDYKIVLFPCMMIVLASLIIIILSLYYYDSFYHKVDMQSNIAYTSIINQDCDYNKFVDDKNSCSVDFVNLDEVINIAKDNEAEHLFIVNENTLEDVYEAGDTISINTYADMNDFEYVGSSNYCSSENIIKGRAPKSNQEFSSSLSYMLTNYGEATLGDIYDSKMLTGITNYDIVCNISSNVEGNWYIDLLDESQYKYFLDNTDTDKINDINYIGDIYYIGDRPRGFSNDMISSTSISTYSKLTINRYVIRQNMSSYIKILVSTLLPIMLIQMFNTRRGYTKLKQDGRNIIHLGYTTMRYDHVIHLLKNQMYKCSVIVYICTSILLILIFAHPFMIITHFISLIITILYINKMIKRLREMM